MSCGGRCKACRKTSLVRDPESTHVVCSSCGIVQGSTEFQASGGYTEPQGSFVNMGTRGAGSNLEFRQKKIYEAEQTTDEILRRLEWVGSSKVKEMLAAITKGEYGMGDWFPVLVGACCYVVGRDSKKPLLIADMAKTVGCEIHQLGSMVNRVKEFFDLNLPEFDIVHSFEERFRKTFSGLKGKKVEDMLRQGVFLMQCAVKWYLTTGRRPLPMIAAVLLFVAQLNEVDVGIEDVAFQVLVKVRTVKLRYKELVESLVKVAKALPWGKDITSKNIMKNAHYVIRYIEVKCMSKLGEKRTNLEDSGFCLDDLICDSLRKEPECVSNGNVVQCGERQDTSDEREDGTCISETEDADGGMGIGSGIHTAEDGIDNLEQINVSSESWYAFPGGSEESQNLSKKRKDTNGSYKWWSGKSQLCEKLVLKQILERDVGLEPMPPSFVNARLAEKRRRQKIVAAKLRIENFTNTKNSELGNTEEFGTVESKHAGKTRRRRRIDIDWEDVIIQTLLLHQVKEEEIEKGNYKALLGLLGIA